LPLAPPGNREYGPGGDSNGGGGESRRPSVGIASTATVISSPKPEATERSDARRWQPGSKPAFDSVGEYAGGRLEAEREDLDGDASATVSFPNPAHGNVIKSNRATHSVSIRRASGITEMFESE